jgi:uncharacterized protein YceH (UPF0502 family)
MEYLAKLAGTSMSQLAKWKKEQGQPGPRFREKFAELSGGLYTADDFMTDRGRERAGDAALPSRAALAENLLELEASVAGLRRTVASLRRRIAALERRLPGEDAGSARGG